MKFNDRRGVAVISAFLLAAAASAQDPAPAQRTAALPGAKTDQVRLRATALRVTGELANAPALERLIKDEERTTKVLPTGGVQKFIADLDALGDVQVLGQPEAAVAANEAGTLRFQTKNLTDHQDRGFLHGMQTRFGLWFQPTRTSDGGFQLSVSGSVLAYTPDTNGTAVLAQNAIYTRMRDFEADVKVADGQPVVVGGPMLQEEGDGGWTAIILVVTPQTASSAVADAPAE